MNVVVAVVAVAGPAAVVAFLYSRDRADVRARQTHTPSPPDRAQKQPAYGRFPLFVFSGMFLIASVVFGLLVGFEVIDNVAAGAVNAAICSLIGSLSLGFGLEHARKLRQRGL